MIFWNKPKEKEIMGMPVSEFFAALFTTIVENHYNGMIDFFNDFMSNATTIHSEPPGSPGSMAFTKISTEYCIKEMYKYYYFIFNEYINPKIQNDNDIDYLLFKKNFSSGAFERIDGNIIFKHFLYNNPGNDNNMFDDDKAEPQFYKEILPYYHSEKIGNLVRPALTIISPYIKSSKLISELQPSQTVENGIINFFSVVFWQLHCLPSTSGSYHEIEKQNNSHYFDRLFNLMVDQTYIGTFSIQKTGEKLI